MVSKIQTYCLQFSSAHVNFYISSLYMGHCEPEDMADKEQIKKTIVEVLCCVEKVSSFASSIDPLFGIITSLVGVVRKGLEDKEDHALDKDFSEIHSKLESISKKNNDVLQQIRIEEVNEIFGRYEEYIKHQYTAFSTMIERANKDPEGKDSYMKDFKDTYEKDKDQLGLKVFYDGVIGTKMVFGRHLLKVYLEHCHHDRKVMEHRCSHLVHLFHIGLIALMAYTSVTNDDEDEIRQKWHTRILEVQGKMEDALRQCKKD